MTSFTSGTAGFFRLDTHIERFVRSAARLQVYDAAVDPGALARILRSTCVTHSGHRNSYVEMVLTRGGFSPTFSRDPRDSRNQLICFAIPFGWIPET